MAIDGCTRQSCGAGAPGGDTKITNVVLKLSSADFQLSTGRTDHAFLLGSFNSGESEIWQKILLYLWSQATQAYSSSFDGFVMRASRWNENWNMALWRHEFEEAGLCCYWWWASLCYCVNV